MPFPKVANSLRRLVGRARTSDGTFDPIQAVAAPLERNPLAALGQLELISRRMSDGLLSGKHRSTHRGGCTDFTEHRPYSNGDDIRMIDWRMHAKNDRYHIKQYEDETNLKATLAVDASGSMAFAGKKRDGADAASKFDTARILASCLGRVLIRQRDAVGLAVVGESIGKMLPPRSRSENVQEMNKALAETTLQGGSRLGICLGDLAARNRSRGMLILFSDCFCSLPELKKGLMAWAQSGHDVLVVEILASDEVDFGFRESLILEDLERPGQKVDIDPGQVRQAYMNRLGSHRKKLSRVVQSCRGEMIRLRTDDLLGDGLKRFLQRRSSKAGGASAGRARR